MKEQFGGLETVARARELEDLLPIGARRSANLTLGLGEDDLDVSLEVRQLPAGDPFPAAPLRTRGYDEGEKSGLRKRVPWLHEWWHQDSVHQALGTRLRHPRKNRRQ